MISVDVSKGRPALEALVGEWEDLIGDSFTSAFSHPAWFLAWIDAFQPQKIAVVTARDEGRLVGVLPLARSRTDARGLFFKQISPIASGDYQAPIVVPEMASTILPLMLNAGFRYFGRHGVFWWPNIPKNDPSLALLRSYFESSHMPVTEVGEACLRLRLDGRDIETVEKDWTASHRKDVRRQRKRLAAERGPVSLWIPSSPQEAEPVLEEFFRVHDEKWLAQGYPGMFHNPRQRTLFRSLLHGLWGHGLHFSTVLCGDVHVSYQFGFFAGGWLQWYRPSYRSEFGVYSPSKIHVALVVEEACRSHWNGVDFLLGDENYKTLWANESIEVVTFHAGFHKWAPSYLWFTKGKPYVKSRLWRTYFDMKIWLQKRRGKTEAA